MDILLYDRVQESNVPNPIKSPSLADTTSFSSLTFTFAHDIEVDCIGVGNYNHNAITVNGEVVTVDESGLYLLKTPILSNTITVETGTGAVEVGRIAFGKKQSLGVSPPREPEFWSTHTSRTTLSGQVIPGAGGVTGRSFGVDIRYKMGESFFNELKKAFPTQIGRNYPVFVRFDSCADSIYPIATLYATIEGFKSLVFQSSANKYLYSKRLSFREAF